MSTMYARERTLQDEIASKVVATLAPQVREAELRRAIVRAVPDATRATRGVE